MVHFFLFSVNIFLSRACLARKVFDSASFLLLLAQVLQCSRALPRQGAGTVAQFAAAHLVGDVVGIGDSRQGRARAVSCKREYSPFFSKLWLW